MATTEKRPEIIELARGLTGIPWCEEYEKMISGMMYDPTVPQLLEARHRCRGLAADFNQVDAKKYSYDQIGNVRMEILKKLVGRIGEGTFIEPPFMPDYGCNMIIGRDCFFNWNMTVLDTSLVVIGDRVQFGPNVSIFSAGHDTSVLSRIKFVEFGHPVFIEDDCWIGGNVIILPGVRIDLPPYSVAVGNPCKVRKTIPSVEEEENDPNNLYRDLVR
ncbi:sugar O-acetyltransferase [Aspergillus glaucus CBS 516.65]|uniref:Maltose/galactoside acetyltransferase domain-containing protein n=1 Tax=Aspergillus glaucus CBS 516.65 TaxID=1160497 RepID=A0A1L9V4V4_ASPGL|nr:hypothetical protein ASPGLDRAFT_1089428 [Aspergillus glaucus CBS 516.65]OJJ78973.1 hypothetical protein ASPGLDRAFT_1089428 [Aspergillus glaucus CBS 516.65]